MAALQTKDNSVSQTARFLIIGNGRVAKHFAFYFSQLNLPVRQWYRQCARPLSDNVNWASHVLLLISDRAIADFVASHPALRDKVLVHFSGGLVIDHVTAAHPLMTFSEVLYSAEFYPSVPFILHGEKASLDHCLPGLPNPHYCIPEQDVPYYHSMCVMANNFSTILWNKCFDEFAQRWQLPREVLLPILRQTSMNIECLSSASLTGPLQRGDWTTTQSHLKALASDDYRLIYQAFVDVFTALKRREE